jgi:ribosomal protein S18 acetylase RimI-like enzyme
VIVRHVELDDVDELAAVGELTVATYSAAGYLKGADDYADELRAAEDRAREAALAVAVDGAPDEPRVVGTVTYCLPGTPWAEVSQPGEAEVRMLAVAAEARGRGVGTVLTSWCVDRARREGRTAVALSTLEVMHAAHRLYERMGFVRTPDRDWWPLPDLRLITYRLAL